MSDDHRQAHRYSMPDERQAAILRSDRFEDTLARVLDESATGFLIELNRPVHFHVDEPLKLRTQTGWCEVKVVYVAPDETDGEPVRIGVRRTRELDDRDEDPQARAHSWQQFQRTLVGALWQPHMCVPLVLLGLALTLLGVTAYQHGCSTALAVPNSENEEKAKDSDQAKRESGTLRSQLLEAKVRSLENLAFSPNLAEKLALSDAQRRQIRKTVEPALKSVSEDDLPLAVQDAIIAKTITVALAQLTPKQQQWFLRSQPGKPSRHDGPSRTERALHGRPASTTKAPWANQVRRQLLSAKVRALERLVSSPDAAADLKLTDEQQQRIRDVIEPRQELISDGKTPAAEKEEVVEQTYSEVFAVLDPRQQQRFLAGPRRRHRMPLRKGQAGEITGGVPEPADAKQRERQSKAILRVLGSLVASPELAAQLKLTPRQQESIRRIIQQAATSGSGGGNTDQMVRQAYTQILATFTPQQRKQVRALQAR